MTRISTTNYAGDTETSFMWGTSDGDRFDRELDLYRLARALEAHNHASGKGLAVARVVNALIDSAQLADGAVTAAKLGVDAVTAIAVALDAIGALELADNAVDTAAIQALAVTAAKLAAGAAASNLAGSTVANDFSMASDKGINFLASTFHTWKVFASAGAFWIQDTTSGFPQLRLSQSNGVPAVYDGTAFRNLLRAGLAEIVTADIANDAITHAKLDSTDTPLDGEYVKYNGTSGKFEYDTPPAAAGVPSGAGIWTPTAASIPSGYTRYTNLDGRIPVGAGTTFSVTWTENTSPGSSWSHAHGMTAYDNHGHSLNGHSHSTNGGTTSSTSTEYDEDETGNGRNTMTSGHTHTQNSVGTSDPGNFGTSAAISSGGASDGTAISTTLPVRVVVWSQRN